MQSSVVDNYSPVEGLQPPRGVGAVRIWLLVIAALVYAMILVGGATRLTDSGLSITEWKPVTGALPPLNADHWASEFQKYKDQTAEYKLQNAGMSMEEFQFIYYWEWGHRLLGRLVGIVFLIPFLVFWVTGRTTPKLRLRLWGLFALGGLQGAIGWWMVSSGVGDTQLTDVAAYRLMVHFSLALLIICAAFWVWLELGERKQSDGQGHKLAIAILVLVALQMMFGALVAGLDAGRTYTDWPLMDGDFVPRGYWDDKGVRNFFENVATTQFNHRIFAYLIVGMSIWAAWKMRTASHHIFLWVAGVALAQTGLGIVTLLNAAPLSLGLIHQALGTALLLASVYAVWRTRASLIK